MNELINILSEKFNLVLDLIQSWWIPISACAGSYWLIIKKVWPWIKGLWDTNKKIKNLEHEKRLLNLREELLATKEELHLAKKDNVRFSEENQKLIQQLTIKENVIWEDGILYYDNIEICSRCYDTSPSTDRKTVRLLPSNHEIKGTFYCPECKIHPRTKEGAAQELNNHREAVRQISGRSY